MNTFRPPQNAKRKEEQRRQYAAAGSGSGGAEASCVVVSPVGAGPTRRLVPTWSEQQACRGHRRAPAGRERPAAAGGRRRRRIVVVVAGGELTLHGRGGTALGSRRRSAWMDALDRGLLLHEAFYVFDVGGDGVVSPASSSGS